MGNFSLNLVNYSVLHIDIDFILVGMIANISDCKDTIILSNNNVFSLKLSVLVGGEVPIWWVSYSPILLF